MTDDEFHDSSGEGEAMADLASLAADAEALVRIEAPAGNAPVRSSRTADQSGNLTIDQTARTLRFALSAFADGRTAPAGPKDRLAGYIQAASIRARLTREQIARRRFRLVFQPVVTLADRTVHHVEALLRPAPGPGRAAATTLDFVTFSEAIGLAEELDLAVLEHTVAMLEKVPDIAIAVNVSGLSLQSRSFRHRLISLGLMYPRRLLVELTETAQIEDAAKVAASLEKLRAIGIAVCIDDFGAGGAAFRYLRDFKVDYVKIDGSYVHGSARNERDRGFVASMLELAHSVGARVIAEMIETEEEAELMQRMGVHLGQGWLFGRGSHRPATRSSTTRSSPAG